MPKMKLIEKQFIHFKDNVDEWMKDISPKVQELLLAKKEEDKERQEFIETTQHNFELIYEMKGMIEELKQEVNALKLIQIVNLKKKNEKRNKR